MLKKKYDIHAFKGIIFDMFHTLTSVSVISEGRGTSEILGVSRDDWNEQLWCHSDDRLRGRLKDGYEIIRRMAHAIDPTISSELIREAVESRKERFRLALMHIEPVVLDVLDQMKSMGKRLGLVSNGDVNEFTGWEGSPLRRFFDGVIFSCNTGFMKPEPQIYELCLDELGVQPCECTYVGDGGSEELCGARELGMTTVLTTRVIQAVWPEKIRERKKCADYEIVELLELLDIGEGEESCRRKTPPK